MSDTQEPSMEAQEEMLRNQAAEADSQGVSIDELQNPIGENSGAAADPDKGNEGADTNNKPSDEDDTDEGDSDTNPQENPESNPDTEGTQNAESSKQNPEGNGAETPATPEDKAKQKAKKEEDRRDRSWKKLEEDKAQFLREKAEWEAAKLTNPATQQSQNNPAQNPNVLADAFDKLAKDFEEAGDFDKADEARQKAATLRAKEQQQPSSPQAQGSQQPANMQSNPQFKVAWNANTERAINDFPEMKDPASDFGKAVTSLLRAPDSASYFAGRPDGVYIAAQLTRMKMTALRVPSMEKEIASLKEEIKKLRQGMSLPETGAQGRGGDPKSIDSMTLEQQEAFFRKQAEIEDASGAPII